MTYYTDLFSPETYEAFSLSSMEISGFREKQENLARNVKPGDRFICYLTKLSRWVGILEVTSLFFKNDSPIFYQKDDPFIIRFHVKPLVWLPKEKGLPIRNPEIWNSLTFTQNNDISGSAWTGRLRSSLNLLDEEDGRFLEQVLIQQSETGKIFEIDARKYKRLATPKDQKKVVSVSIPQDNTAVNNLPIIEEQKEVRESIKMQALIAKIGAQMGMKIWLPRADRTAVIQEWDGNNKPVLDGLPLNYDEATLKTIEQIDVLWLKGHSIIRAFEVEHTTSVYSGILRMADLLALQPNMDIKLHIVAPASRREKVFQELRRPVFSLLERGPLSDKCTYLPYESIREISKDKHLQYLSDSVLDEYAESAT